MPTYEYKCKAHGHIFEVEQKMSDEPLTKCQICDSEVERLIGMPTIFCKDSASSPIRKISAPTPTNGNRCANRPSGPPKRTRKRSRETGIRKRISGFRVVAESRLVGDTPGLI